MFPGKSWKVAEYCMYFPLFSPQYGGKRPAVQPRTIYSEVPKEYVFPLPGDFGAFTIRNVRSPGARNETAERPLSALCCFCLMLKQPIRVGGSLHFERFISLPRTCAGCGGRRRGRRRVPWSCPRSARPGPWRTGQRQTHRCGRTGYAGS